MNKQIVKRRQISGIMFAVIALLTFLGTVIGTGFSFISLFRSIVYAAIAFVLIFDADRTKLPISIRSEALGFLILTILYAVTAFMSRISIWMILFNAIIFIGFAAVSLSCIISDPKRKKIFACISAVALGLYVVGNIVIFIIILIMSTDTISFGSIVSILLKIIQFVAIVMILPLTEQRAKGDAETDLDLKAQKNTAATKQKKETVGIVALGIVMAVLCAILVNCNSGPIESGQVSFESDNKPEVWILIVVFN